MVACRYAEVGEVKAEVEGCRELKSRLGSGRLFWDAKSATCSILTSTATNERLLATNNCLMYLSRTGPMQRVLMRRRIPVLILVHAH
jgi:hypothetical protein